MSAKMIKRTTVVFEHEISLEQFPQLLNYSEAQLTELLNGAVVSMFALKEREAEINEHGSHSFIRVKEVI
ncbi:hypothetical protein EB001_16080 [bacterium]|nr:hypothetical protein [bacterium]